MRPQPHRHSCPPPSNIFDIEGTESISEPCLPCGIPIDSLKVIIGALRRVHAGSDEGDPDPRPAVDEPALPASGEVALAGGAAKPLSPREHQILELLVEGATDKEVAQALGLARSTVQSHVGAICQKTGALNRVHLGVAAVRFGLVTGSPGGPAHRGRVELGPANTEPCRDTVRERRRGFRKDLSWLR